MTSSFSANPRNGDADLYVSESIGKPSFELSEHSSSSATCGRDEVDLPRSVSRPVHVAVYGHPRFEVGGEGDLEGSRLFFFSNSLSLRR